MWNKWKHAASDAAGIVWAVGAIVYVLVMWSMQNTVDRLLYRYRGR